MSIRAVAFGSKTLHLVGVPSYNTSQGANEIFRFFEAVRPSTLLMESYIGEATSGAVLPYRQTLGPGGQIVAEQLVQQPHFQQNWTSETVGLLAALRNGAEIRMADRLHATSFNRLIASRSLDGLKHDLIDATETVATHMEQRAADPPEGTEPASLLMAPQNALCTCFEELWGERHLLMAFFTHAALKSDCDDVALMVGTEHIQPVAALVEALPRDILAAEVIDDHNELLNAPPEATAGSHGLGSAEIIEKRAALAALLVSTRAFNPELVLPAADGLPEEMVQMVSSVYPRYRAAFEGRMTEARRVAEQVGGPEAQQAQQDLFAALQGGTSTAVSGLAQLPALCESLA